MAHRVVLGEIVVRFLVGRKVLPHPLGDRGDLDQDRKEDDRDNRQQKLDRSHVGSILAP